MKYMTAKKLALQARRQEALLLAIRGKTGREIMQAINAQRPESEHISESTAWRDVRAALAAQVKAHAKEIDTFRALIAERYTRLFAAWIKQAESEPESKAGDKVLRVLEGLRALYGLDRPVEKKEEDGAIFPAQLVMTTVYVGDDETRGAGDAAAVG